ncbi:MAG: hypothetical protein HC889_20480, partial [Synechococcaceae cyanobacterium SM1_2_3]|nr:hypothetical protein [Synechococcaceae cyanobacterium SM1_2_3]
MTTLEPINDELRRLRAEVAELRALVLRPAPNNQFAFPQFVRLAKTWTANTGDYPAATELESFPFVFCDQAFRTRS